MKAKVDGEAPEGPSGTAGGEQGGFDPADQETRSDVLRARSDMQEALSRVGGVSAISEALQGVAQAERLAEQVGGFGNLASQLAEHQTALSATGGLADALEGSGLRDRMNGLASLAEHGSSLSKAAEGIVRQQKLIDTMRAPPPSMPDIHLATLKSPTMETNERLERIERKVKQVADLAAESAQVAANLQASAAEFLQKFEKAAEDTNEASQNAVVLGKQGVIIGRLALAIAIIVGVGQVVTPYFIPATETEVLRQTVVELQGEVAAMRVDQKAATDRIVEAVSQSGQATASALREALESVEMPTVPVE